MLLERVFSAPLLLMTAYNSHTTRRKSSRATCNLYAGALHALIYFFYLSYCSIHLLNFYRNFRTCGIYNPHPPAPHTHSQPKIEALHLQQPVHNPCCNAALVHDFKLCAVVSRDECDHIGICSKACACYL